MSQNTLTPYLFFGGRCEEAVQFYRDKVGATVEMMMRFSDSPDPTPEGMLPPGFEHKIMHGSLSIGGARFMVSDGCDPNGKFQGFSLALATPTEADAHVKFNALADGGSVTMPLTKTFWSPCYGMLKDKFGVEWMVMVRDQSAG